MHILFVHCRAVLLADTAFVGVTRVGLMSDCAQLSRSCTGVRSALWLRAPRSPMVHACHDSCFPVLFSALLSDTYPIVTPVSNGLRPRSPRMREKFGRFIHSDPV